MEDNTFLQGVSIIEEVTQKNFSDKQLEIYKMMLNDIDDKKFMEGIKKLLQERVYSNLPQVAEIRQYCLGTKEEELESKITKAGHDIKRAINGVGTHTSIVFDNPIIHLVIRDVGGWSTLGKMKLTELEKFITWELPKLYKIYAGEKNKNIPLVLSGRAYNFDNPKNQISYFGDKETIDKWQSGYVKKYYDSLDYKNVKYLEDLNVKTEGLISYNGNKKVNTDKLLESMVVK